MAVRADTSLRVWKRARPDQSWLTPCCQTSGMTSLALRRWRVVRMVLAARVELAVRVTATAPCTSSLQS